LNDARASLQRIDEWIARLTEHAAAVDLPEHTKLARATPLSASWTMI